MSATVRMERTAEVSPRFKARMAGVLYLLSVLTATFTETFVRGRLNIAGGLIAIAGMVGVTLLVYRILDAIGVGNRGFLNIYRTEDFGRLPNVVCSR
jgi:hypothetical protein